jgi:hypothetical protein
LLSTTVASINIPLLRVVLDDPLPAEVFAKSERRDGCLLVGKTSNRAAEIVAITPPSTVFLDSWPSVVATERVVISTPPVDPDEMRYTDIDEGSVIMLVRRQSGITREVGIVRDAITWLMATGGGAAARSGPFYIPPKVTQAALEMDWTHANPISIQRYHGDWRAARLTDIALLPAAVAGWANWPPGDAQIAALVPAGGGTYAAHRRLVAGPWTSQVDLEPGFYRLTTTVAAGLDKVFHVLYAKPWF